MEKIDFVIIWVDGSDPKWLKEKKQYSQTDNADSRNVRYRDWENLRYLFRGIEKFAPWVNRVHFVTCGHLPEWLNISCDKLNIVKHSDYIPEKYLPTFSSHPIELNLHRIPNLAEKFVYFNDDMFLTNETSPSDFFKNSLPCTTAILTAIAPNGKDFFEHILLNNMNVINRNFDKKNVILGNFTKWFSYKYGMEQFRTLLLLPWSKMPGMKYSHLPTSFLKSSFDEVWSKEYDVLNTTCDHKFRNILDVNQWLIEDWQIASGKFCPRNVNIGKLFMISDSNQDMLDAIKKRKYKMICLNDDENIQDFDQVKMDIQKAFEEILPDKSMFEK